LTFNKNPGIIPGFFILLRENVMSNEIKPNPLAPFAAAFVIATLGALAGYKVGEYQNNQQLTAVARHLGEYLKQEIDYDTNQLIAVTSNVGGYVTYARGEKNIDEQQLATTRQALLITQQALQDVIVEKNHKR
jgi:hypothetical protein